MTLAVRYGVEMDLYPWFMDRLEIDIVQHLDFIRSGFESVLLWENSR